LSALDIEREIIGLEYIAEAVVVGVEDEEYGQKVAAAIVQRKEVTIILAEDGCEDSILTNMRLRD
jgi:malonyl-CoA/methylmalonyl-CoA synthetase